MANLFEAQPLNLTVFLMCLIVGCSDDVLTSSSTSCTDLTANTTETSTSNSNGCALLSRDTSSCEEERTAQGLSGFWLNFSCRVDLTVSGTNVVITSDGYPDYKSAYFESSHGCYEDSSISGRYINPNTIAEQSIVMTVPMSPTSGSGTEMSLGVVGVAANGVAIFNNEAAPGDSIYDEVASFDSCEGHPQSSGTYHYHIEPPAISNDDAYFVGVLRDGFPVYGVKEENGSTPSLDSYGGHTGTTLDSVSSTYHYHVHLQTSGSDSAYFVTSGEYAGNVGECSGCN